MITLLGQAWRQPWQWLLGQPLRDGGAGLESTLEHSWPWPPWLTLLLVIACAALVLVIYLHEGGTAGRGWKIVLALIRLCLVGMVILMMYGFVVRPYRTDLPEIVVLVDDSASMSLADHYENGRQHQDLVRRVQAVGLPEVSRINLAKAILLQQKGVLLRQLRQNYQLRLRWLGAAASAPAGEIDALVAAVRAHPANHPTSRLGDRLRRLLEEQRGRPTAAVIVLSDGITTEGKTIGDTAQYARRKGIPLFLVGIGNNQPARDIELDNLLADEIVFVNDVVNFDFTVTSTGYESQTVEVRLRRNGQTAPLAKTRVKLAADRRPSQVRLAHRPAEKGEFEYVVEVDRLPGEAKPNNNQQSRRIEVRDEKIRVLLVQAYPNYEFRYLKNLLGRQKTNVEGQVENPIELTTVLQDADLEYAETDATARRVFPVRRDELFQYDVIIFGDVNPSYLSVSAMNNLVDFVGQQGRAMIFLAGANYTPLQYRGTPLAQLIPFEINTAMVPPEESITESFVVRPTPLGLASPHMQLGDTSVENMKRWQRLPPLYWLLEVSDPKPGVRVLAEHPSRTGRDGRNLPVLCLQYIGAGKVVFHATDETWRWRYRVGDAWFARYWMQTIRYLSRSKLGEDRAAELVADRERFRRGDPLRLRARFFDDRLAPEQDDGVTVVLEQEGHKNRRIKLHRTAAGRGIFEGTVHHLTEGKYHAWMATPSLEGGSPSCDFSVTVPDSEMARLEMDAADLQAAARQSEGQFYTVETAAGMLGDLPRGRQVRIEALPPRPVWNAASIALLFIALFVSEWLLRKRAGLL